MGAGAIPITVAQACRERALKKRRLPVFFAGSEYKGAGAVDVSFHGGAFFVSPPRELLLDYRLGRISPEVFEQAYVRFLEQSLVENRHNWDTLLGGTELVLLCSCAPDDPACHRHVLARFLKRFGAVFKGVRRTGGKRKSNAT